MTRRAAQLSIIAIVFSLALGGSVARAEVPDPGPKLRASHFAHGIFTEGHIGATIFLGNTGKVTRPGPAFALRMGYDLFSWLALYVHGQGSFHEATPPPPPENQHFQSFLVGGGARLQLSIGRFGIFANGTTGIMFFSSNVLDRTGITTPQLRSSFAFGGGGGLDWHTWNRHFSFGLSGDYVLSPSLANTSALTTTAYLRYVH
jgi:hypothetical protein